MIIKKNRRKKIEGLRIPSLSSPSPSSTFPINITHIMPEPSHSPLPPTTIAPSLATILSSPSLSHPHHNLHFHPDSSPPSYISILSSPASPSSSHSSLYITTSFHHLPSLSSRHHALYLRSSTSSHPRPFTSLFSYLLPFLHHHHRHPVTSNPCNSSHFISAFIIPSPPHLTPSHVSHPLVRL